MAGIWIRNCTSQVPTYDGNVWICEDRVGGRNSIEKLVVGSGSSRESRAIVDSILGAEACIL